MDLALKGLVGLIVLFSFVAAFMSAKTWRVWHVVLVELIFLSSLGYFYMAARTLATHRSWRELVIKTQGELEKVEKEILEKREGVEAQGKVAKIGIRQLKAELHKITLRRGIIWNGVKPEKVDPATGVAQVKIEAPDPHTLAVKDIVFVFDEKNVQDGGRYLGEFVVTAAPDKSKNLELSPNPPLSAGDLEKFTKSTGPWTLYKMLPIDSEEVFAALDENDKRQMLPKESLPEYLAPGRALRDYTFLLHENQKQQHLTADLIAKATHDLERTEAEQKKTEKEVQYREKEKSELAFDLEHFQYEQKVVSDYHKLVAAQRDAASARVREIFLSNVKLADALTAAELKALEEVNQRIKATTEAAGASAAPAAKP